MGRLRSIASLSLILSVASAPAHAQDAHPLLPWLQGALGALWTDTARDEAALQLVGFAIPAPTPDDLAQSSAAATLTLLLDGVPPGVGTTSVTGVFEEIMRGGEVAPFHRTPGQQRAINAALRVLEERGPWYERWFGIRRRSGPSRAWREYERFAGEYAKAVQAVQEGTGTQAQVSIALDRWRTLGHRAEIEAAIARHDSATRADPAAWWGSVRDAFDASADARRNNPRAVALTYGNIDGWLSDDGWIPVRLKSADGRFQATLDVKRVALARPWLDASVFRSRAWRWQDADARASVISDGRAETRPDEMLPFVPDALLLSRRAVIDAADGLRIESPEPHVLGWIGEPLPKSPDPDPALWQPVPEVPVPRYRVGIGVFQALTFNRRAPHVGGGYVTVAFRRPALGLLVGLAPGTRLRGPGLSLGWAPRLASTRFRAVAGVRFPIPGGGAVRPFLGVAADLWSVAR